MAFFRSHLHKCHFVTGLRNVKHQLFLGGFHSHFWVPNSFSESVLKKVLSDSVKT